MTRPPEPDLSGAEALLAVYDGRAALLRRALARVREAIGDPAHALRYLMEGRTIALGGRTPCEVLQHGEAELLLYSLNVMQHGLCA